MLQPVATPCPAEALQGATAEPLIPDDAGIPTPSTLAEADATKAFLVWMVEALEWGREEGRRLDAGKLACNKS